MPDSFRFDVEQTRPSASFPPLDLLSYLAEFERRKAFIGLSAENIATLQRIRPILSGIAPIFIGTLYKHLDECQDAIPALTSAHLEHLKVVHSDYFNSLVAGHYDEAYLKDRLDIAGAHVCTELPPSLYICGYCHYLADMLPALHQALSAEGEDIQAALQAILRVTLLDIGLTIEAYITQRDQNIEQLNDYMSVFDNLPLAIGHWHADLSTGDIHCSIEASHLFGLPEVPSVTLPELLSHVHDEDRPHTEAAWQAALDGAPLLVEHRLATTKTLRWVEVRGQFKRDSTTGKVLAGVGTVYDVTSSKIAKNQIQQLAYFDTLTGLPNRVSALEQLRQATLPDKQGPTALLFLDVDHFKDVNDTQGHATGDQALMKVVLRLTSVLRQNEPLARLGGDEFIIVLEGADEDAAAMVAQRLIQAMREPIRCSGMTFSLGLSVGIARFPDDGDNAQDLLRQADTAMYQAKRQGGNSYKFYHADMSASLQRQLEMQIRLDMALRSNTLQMHYQPIFDLSQPNRPAVGAEALLRWHDDDWGWVGPSEFIPVAESRGLIHALGEWSLTHVSRQIRRWKDEGLILPGRISVNVSAREMEDTDFVERAIRLVHDAGAQPTDLELELTERSLIKDPQQAKDMALALTAAGFRLALDDFGTGYSSLAQLRHFPVQKLKIDMSFVNDMLTNTGDRAIVRSIISMADALRLQTVAEGVEQPAQADALHALGCQLAQGNSFSQPLPPQTFSRWWLRPATQA